MTLCRVFRVIPHHPNTGVTACGKLVEGRVEEKRESMVFHETVCKANEFMWSIYERCSVASLTFVCLTEDDFGTFICGDAGELNSLMRVPNSRTEFYAELKCPTEFPPAGKVFGFGAFLGRLQKNSLTSSCSQ